ncbi:M43 family zinc metalloprotease [Gelidibacter maritimus]|uniref:T9SS type A sorting domain-containing protein n=1 Tax=Gelidibacter maritimus TaxID=2761487 RepID=A0A7W2M8T3_9FLAO|nr:M43 family zinc metalloprotease [Gelidibacter maritimus]MBA6154785.1 T9SS type A sorting domain-containing protein [Gelidibacter maritimus]
MKFKLLFILFIFSSLKVSAQGLPCRASEENAKVYRNNPSALQEKMDFDMFSKRFALQQSKKSSKADGESYVIPVVFHIYGDVQSGQTVTYQKIVNHLAHLNDDFNGRNDDFNTVEPFFQDRRGTLGIEFKLAKIDPNGGCTNGVVFHPAKNGYGNGGGYDSQIAVDAWDNTKYMNVYIQNDLYNDGQLTNSGVAWYPSTSMTNNNTARVVYNGAYLYDNSSNKEFSAVLTHEFGHFLNLIHTFEGGCSGTDQVDDTPAEDGYHDLGCTPGTNCNGDKVNIENYMGYNGAQGCYKMYTQGQIDRMLAALQHPARVTLWQPQNLIDTGVNATGSSLLASATSFKEAVINDGSFDTSSTISLDGSKEFVMTSGTMVSDTHFTHNFPVGIIPVLTVNSNNQVTITLTGNAMNHDLNDNATGEISFLPAAFTGGTDDLTCNSLFFYLKYADPYGIFFVDMPDVVISSALTWEYFEIAMGDDPAFGGWRFDANELKIETYDKNLVCETGTRNISLLASNVAINAASNFTAPEAYPNQLDLRNAGYTDWDGKTGYVGFDYLIDGATCYGWFKVTVDANGDGYTISEYAYNTEPGATIYTGVTPKVGVVISPDIVYESDENDGSISTTSEISLSTNNATFTKDSGTFTLDTDYTVAGIPDGLTAVLTLQSNSTVVVSFEGKATSHLPANDADVVISFLDDAISGGVAILENPSKSINLKFEIPYGIYYVNNEDYIASASAAEPWDFFDLGIGDETEYGAWLFSPKNLKIETYGKRLVGDDGTRNITLLTEGSIIDSNSNFVAPGSYPNYLDLRTDTYTTWDDQTGYVGFEYTRRGRVCYGWMYVTVDADGEGFTVLGFAYNTKPNDPIAADQQLVTVLAPMNLVVEGDNNELSATITWENYASNATNLIVERSGADNVFTEIANLPSTETTYTDMGLLRDVIYQYRVIAQAFSDYSEYSNVVSITLTEASSSGLSSPIITDGGIYDVGFYANWGLVDDATEYDIEIKNDLGEWITVGSTSEYYYWIGKVESQIIYEFRVRAKNETEFSDWSYAIVNLDELTLVLSTQNYELDNTIFTMYPNPAVNLVKFSFKQNADEITLTIYNTNGVLIDRVKNASSYSVSHLAKGMYIIVVSDGQIFETKKLIVK